MSSDTAANAVVVASDEPSWPVDAEQLSRMFLDGRSAATIDAYRRDLLQFAAFVGAPAIPEALPPLLSGTLGEANALVLRFRNDLLARGFAAASINRKLASVRAIVTLARMLGIVAWSLQVSNVRSRAYRDTAGPGDVGVRKLLAAASAQADNRKAARDVALIRLLHDVALRRAESCCLDVADFDPVARRVLVRGKGRTEKEAVTLPVVTNAALVVWLELRGREPGPLLLTFDISQKWRGNGRLTGGGVWTIVRRLGREAGLTAWPHGLRHTAVTRALDVTGGDLRRAQRFSRHRDVRTLMIYDDNRQDLAAGVADLVALADE